MRVEDCVFCFAAGEVGPDVKNPWFSVGGDGPDGIAELDWEAVKVVEDGEIFRLRMRAGLV